jgi:multidrug efflux system membrane fusion protein
MTSRQIAGILCLGIVCTAGPIGCGSRPATKEDIKTEVNFVLPQWKDNIQDYVEYTGRTAAVGSVDIKARVTGFLLDTMLFHEGEAVTKGQKLFLIDPAPYDAQLKQAEAQVGLYEAQVELNTKTYEQKVATKKKNPDAITDLDLRTTEAQMKISQAGLEAARASLKIYQLNKDYTTVTSPIAGVVGRRNQTPGNVIMQDQTLLTTVVSLDRMYVYFDMDAPTYAQFQGKQEKPTKAPITMELPTASSSATTTQPSQVTGEVDFFNNQFNPATDTILVRGIFDNPMKKEGGARLRPGMFVRVRVSIGEPYKALVVPDRAILAKMGKKYLYVVGDDNKVKELPVVIGQLQEQGLRVIRPGQLKATDRVIVTRLLDIQPNQEVQPNPLESSSEK